jgi:hypothetical protein
VVVLQTATGSTRTHLPTAKPALRQWGTPRVVEEITQALRLVTVSGVRQYEIVGRL